MSRISELLKKIVSPANKSNPKKQSEKFESASQMFVAKTHVWMPNGVEPKAAIEAKEKLGKVCEGKTINVPVYHNETESHVVQRGLGMLADEAGVSDESKHAFVKKWSEELGRVAHDTSHQKTETSTEANVQSVQKISKQAALWMETYPLTLRPELQTRAESDLEALRHAEMFGFNIKDPKLRHEVKANLRAIIVGSSEEQTAAAQMLLQKAQIGQPEADKIYEVTKALTSIGEMRLNSALNMAKLKMDASKYQQLGEQSSKISDRAEIFAKKLEQSSEKRDYWKNKRQELGNSKIVQSTWVDEQAALLLDNLGIKEKSRAARS